MESEYGDPQHQPQDIPITEPATEPKKKRGWPKGRPRGPRKPKQDAPETPVEAPPSPEASEGGEYFRKELQAAAAFARGEMAIKPRKPRVRRSRYPVSLIVGKRRYRGTRIEFKGLFAIVHDAKGQEMVNLTAVPSFRLEGDPNPLTFAKPQSTPDPRADRGYDGPPQPFPVTGTVGAVMPRVASMADREAEVRRFKEQQRRELEATQGPEAFG